MKEERRRELITNFMCEHCDKVSVCKIYDILRKFDEDAKVPLGVDITINQCSNFDEDSDGDDDE